MDEELTNDIFSADKQNIFVYTTWMQLLLQDISDGGYGIIKNWLIFLF